MRIHPVVPPPPPSPSANVPGAPTATVGNTGQSFSAAATKAADGTTTTVPIAEKPHGGGGGGHAKKTGSDDAIRQAVVKATVTTQQRAKGIDERRAEIARLQALYREQSQKVRERSGGNRRPGGLDLASATFNAFVHALSTAFVAQGIGVGHLHVDGCCATLSVFACDRTRADTVTLLLWDDGDRSKITVLLDRSDGTIRSPLEVFPPFDEATARDLASGVIASLRGSPPSGL